LLACLNGVVLASPLLSAWQSLHGQTPGVQHAATTIFPALLLVVGLGISYRIVAVRVIRPLSMLVYQLDNLAFDHSHARYWMFRVMMYLPVWPMLSKVFSLASAKRSKSWMRQTSVRGK
jgi:hypothetical protein